MNLRLGLAVICIPLWLAGGCAATRPLTEDERTLLTSPPAAVSADVERLLPEAIANAEEREREVLAQGRPLSEHEIALARKIGVQNPEQVRISTVQKFRTPQTRSSASVNICALTSGHGIQVNSRCRYQRRILAHELTHVVQFERLGLREFEREFLLQMILVGSTRAPLEMQASDNEPLGVEDRGD